MSLRSYLLAFIIVLFLHYLPVFLRALSSLNLFAYWSILSLAWLVLTIAYIRKLRW